MRQIVELPAGQVLAYALVDARVGAPSVVVYNPSARVRGPLAELDPAKVADALRISAYGGFLDLEFRRSSAR